MESQEKKLDIAIVGASGNVGQYLLDIIDERQFSYGKLYALASSKSKGKELHFGDNKSIIVQDVSDFDFSKVAIALFSAGSEVAKIYGEKASHQGCIVIDNSSCYRYDDDIPLIVPQINSKDLIHYKNKNIIANPNCSTIQMVMALKEIDDKYGIERVVVSTYQSVSGAGKRAIDELLTQVKDSVDGKTIKEKFFTKPILFNAIPHIDIFMDDKSTKEEWKMKVETQKILNPSIKVHANCVRIPSIIGHGEFINVETKKKNNVEDIKKLWKDSSLVQIKDEMKDGGYMTPFETKNEDAVFVSRIRKDDTTENGFSFWCVSNNMRKGAALNAVEIAEVLQRDYL